MKKQLTCNNCQKQFERNIYKEWKSYYCDLECYSLYRRKNAKWDSRSGKNKVSTMDEVLDNVKNVLPVTRTWNEYRLFCEKATQRIMGNEKNPYK